jgi:hypothetical protein
MLQGDEDNYTILVGKLGGGWRKLHNEELHNLYSFPSIKSRR